MRKNILFLEPFADHFHNLSLPVSVEPNISTLRNIKLLRACAKVDFLDLKTLHQNEYLFQKRLKKIKYDYIFLELKTYSRFFAIELIEIIRKNSKFSFIFCFGHHASQEPAFILNRYNDIYLIQNEEYSFFLQFHKLLKAKVTITLQDISALPNLIYNLKQKVIKSQQLDITDLDSLPLMDLNIMKQNSYYTLYPMKTFGPIKWAFLNLTKGCPYQCIYCSQSLRITYGAKIYQFSIAESLMRIQRLIDNNFTFIRFVDDDFLSNPQYILELCTEIIKSKLKFRWMAQIRADKLNDKLALAMSRAGCECLNIGVESGSDRVLKILQKGETSKDISNCFEYCHKYNILTVAYFMIGNPTETMADINSTFNLMKKIKPHMIQIAYFTPYPGTSYYEKIPAQHREYPDFHHYKSLIANYSKIDSQVLRKIMLKWYISFYLSPKVFVHIFLLQSCRFLYYPKRECIMLLKVLIYVFELIKKNMALTSLPNLKLTGFKHD